MHVSLPRAVTNPETHIASVANVFVSSYIYYRSYPSEWFASQVLEPRTLSAFIDFFQIMIG